MPDTTPPRVIGRPFQPGNPGRPKGSRNKLGESFLDAMLVSFTEQTAEGKPAGIEAIRRTRDADPAVYTRVIASLLPKEITGADGEQLIAGIQITFVKPSEPA